MWPIGEWVGERRVRDIRGYPAYISNRIHVPQDHNIKEFYCSMKNKEVCIVAQNIMEALDIGYYG
jgi:hypothetical protein